MITYYYHLQSKKTSTIELTQWPQVRADLGEELELDLGADLYWILKLRWRWRRSCVDGEGDLSSRISRTLSCDISFHFIDTRHEGGISLEGQVVPKQDTL